MSPDKGGFTVFRRACLVASGSSMMRGVILTACPRECPNQPARLPQLSTYVNISYYLWPFLKMAATAVMDQICDGSISIFVCDRQST